MTDQLTEYVPAKPGDLISAEAWNTMQTRVKEDIAAKVGAAVAAIKTVDQSRDSEKLAGKSTDDLAKHILDYVMRQLPARTGYLSVFRELTVGAESVISHKLGAFPLVDVYQLDYFDVVASEDGHVTREQATFFLHHASERTIRFREGDGSATQANAPSVNIDPPTGHPYHIPFKHMLELYGVATPDDASLGDIETEFWQAFAKAPNDRFGDNQIFHSPWFDRCCREERTWHSLARDIDDLYFQCRPNKTVNLPPPPPKADAKPAPQQPAPSMVQVTQFDFDAVGLKLLAPPSVPATWPKETVHLKVLVLLKV